MSKTSEAARQLFHLLALDYNPYHNPTNGEFTSAGSGGKIGGTKYAPSPQRSHKGIQLNPKTYAKLTGILNTRFPGLEAGEIRRIYYNAIYTVEADGYGGMAVLSVRRIKSKKR